MRTSWPSRRTTYKLCGPLESTHANQHQRLRIGQAPHTPPCAYHEALLAGHLSLMPPGALRPCCWPRRMGGCTIRRTSSSGAAPGLHRGPTQPGCRPAPAARTWRTRFRAPGRVLCSQSILCHALFYSMPRRVAPANPGCSSPSMHTGNCIYWAVRVHRIPMRSLPSHDDYIHDAVMCNQHPPMARHACSDRNALRTAVPAAEMATAAHAASYCCAVCCTCRQS